MCTGVAYGDESMRQSLQPQLYLLCACTVKDGSAASSQLASLLPRGAQKLHWRDMDWRLKRKSLRLTADVLGPYCLIVPCAYSGKQERARRKCLEAMLPDLENHGLACLVLESREERDNKRDTSLLLSLRSRCLIGGIDVAHQRGKDNPLLWLPDQILGAYGDTLCKSPRYETWENEWELIRPSVEVRGIEI